jgi:hypothetical protein
MSRHNTIRAALAVTAAAFAVGASGAGAMPIRDGSPPAKAPNPHAAQLYDAGHASLAMEQAQTQASAQDILHTQGATKRVDLRSPDTRDAAINSGTAKQPVVQGPPKFSTAHVVALHSTQPVVKDDGNDIPLLGIILGLAGAVLLGACAAFAVTRTTQSRRARVTA